MPSQAVLSEKHRKAHTIRGQAFAGYIHAKSGKHLVYHLVVNNVPFRDLNDLLQIFQDQGTISAMLWRDN